MENNTFPAIVDSSSGKTVQLTLLIIIEVFAMISTLFLLLYILFHWRMMMQKTLNNRAIFLIIIVSFLYLIGDLPLTIKSYQLNSRAVSFCGWWGWIDNSLPCISLFLAATASIQRYFLLFKSHLLRIHRTRWLVHYIPLMISIIYPSLFYCAVIIVYPCRSSNDNDNLFCLNPCYVNNPILFHLDWILHSALPWLVIICTHATLFVWMIYTRRSFKRRDFRLWKRQKRLFRQLLAFSSLYVIVWTPIIVESVVDAFLQEDVSDSQALTVIHLNFISNFVCPLQPIIYLFLLPEPIQFIKTNVRRFLGQSVVEPVVIIRR